MNTTIQDQRADDAQILAIIEKYLANDYDENDLSELLSRFGRFSEDWLRQHAEALHEKLDRAQEEERLARSARPIELPGPKPDRSADLRTRIRARPDLRSRIFNPAYARN